MINTVLKAIERFESSGTFEEDQLPTSIFDNGDENDTNTLVDTDYESSDDSDEYKELQEQRSSKVVQFQTDPALIKQTLKDKIRTRRESEGAQEITALFEPPRQYELTPEEEIKSEIRKQRNRRSATRSRLKRIANEKKLEQDAEALEEEHAKRTREVNTLMRIKLLFTTLLQNHLPRCQGGAATHSSRMSEQASTSCPAVQTTGDIKTTPGLQNQLPLPRYDRFGESQSTQDMNQSAVQLRLPLKRKATEEVNGQPFKIPSTWNPIQYTHMNAKPICTAAQTCTVNNSSELLARNTNIVTSEIDTINAVPSVSMAKTVNGNVLSEIASINGNIQPQFSSHGSNNSLGLSTTSLDKTFSVNQNLSDRSLNTNVTEQQKINQIKLHLLDGFPVKPPL